MKRVLTFILLLAISSCSSPGENEKIAIKNGDVNIAYNISGIGDTALLFVHGWCINKNYWQKQEDYFDKRFKVISIDLGGHGQSGHNRNSWTVNDFAQDVVAVINRLKLNKIILVGHSMGGDIVLKVLNSIPEKIIGLVGIDNFKDVKTQFTPEEKEQINIFMQQLKSNFDSSATVYSKATLFPPNYKDTISINRVIKDIQTSDSTVAYQALESSLQSFLKEPEMLSQLKIPLYLIESDYIPVGEKALKKYCKAGYFISTIQGTGHYPMIEKPDEFNLALEATLNKISDKK